MKATKDTTFMGWKLGAALKRSAKMNDWCKEDQLWPFTLLQWDHEEVKELERRIHKVQPASGYWDTILTYSIGECLAALKDPSRPELQDEMMKCVLEYRKEIGK